MATIVTAQPDQDRKGPGRPRSARADEVILAAVTTLLVEGTTAEALTIEAVAHRAGVGKATIYRRWANKDALLIDAVAAMKGPLPEIAGVSVRDDLRTLLRPVGHSPAVSQAASVLPCLISELRRSPALNSVYQKIAEQRRQALRDVLTRGIAVGELRADINVEVVIAMLVGPMVAQNLLNWNPGLEPSTLPDQLVSALWPAIAAAPDPAPGGDDGGDGGGAVGVSGP